MPLMLIRTRYLLYALALLMIVDCSAQVRSGRYPVIGRECPDFAIRNMQNVPDSVLQLSSLKGQFVILDFWSKSCSACVNYFPELNARHKEFGQKVKFILIGTEDKEERMRPMYEKIRIKLEMLVPFAFDSTLFNEFVPGIVPHLVWIDNKGIVQAVTGASDLTQYNLLSFLEGDKFPFYDWSVEAIEGRQSKRLDIEQPLFHNDNGGTTDEFISRSLIVPYRSDRMAFTGLPANIDRFIKFYNNKGLLQGCANLEKLYRFAHTGYPSWFYNDPVYREFYPRCVLNLRDKTAFEMDGASFEGFYWYSLLIPEELSTKDRILQAVQTDLKRAFGYHVRIEKRKMPCRILTSTRQARRTLRSSGKSSDQDHIEPAEVILTHTSMEKFISSVFYKHIENEPPIFNNTGIKHAFDVDITINLYDLDDIRQTLKSMGLTLKDRKKKMKVIVISDPKS